MHKERYPDISTSTMPFMSKSAASSLVSCSVRQPIELERYSIASSKIPSQQKQDLEKETRHLRRPRSSTIPLQRSSRATFEDVLDPKENIAAFPGDLPARPDKDPQPHSFQHAHHSTSSHSWTSTLHSPPKPCFTTMRGHRKAFYILHHLLKLPFPWFERKHHIWRSIYTLRPFPDVCLEE